MSGSNFMKTAAGLRFKIDHHATPASRARYLKMMEKSALPTFASGRLPQTKAKDIKELGFSIGDLVYVTKGPAKGIVTKLGTYRYEENTFMLEGGPTRKHIVPKPFWQEQQDSHIVEMNHFVAPDEINLASKVKKEDGTIQTIVAGKIIYKDAYYDDRYKKVMPRRLVQDHEHIEIPWPTPPAVEDDALCTSSEMAMEKTYEITSLLEPPFNPDALPTIRNPHSKHRKPLLTARDVFRATPPTMPLTEAKKAHIAEIELKKQTPFKRLSPEIQELIGSKIADKLNSITDPHLRAHLDDLSNKKVHDLQKTLSKIRD